MQTIKTEDIRDVFEGNVLKRQRRGGLSGGTELMLPKDMQSILQVL